MIKDDHNSKSRKELSKSKLPSQMPKGKSNVRDMRSFSKSKHRIEENSSSLEHSSSNEKRVIKKPRKPVP
jgi:hypothetical protein